MRRRGQQPGGLGTEAGAAVEGRTATELDAENAGDAPDACLDALSPAGPRTQRPRGRWGRGRWGRGRGKDDFHETSTDTDKSRREARGAPLDSFSCLPNQARSGPSLSWRPKELGQGRRQGRQTHGACLQLRQGHSGALWGRGAGGGAEGRCEWRGSFLLCILKDGKGVHPSILRGNHGVRRVWGKHALAGVRDGLQGEGGRGEALAVSGRQGRPKGRSRRARCRERQPRDYRLCMALAATAS